MTKPYAFSNDPLYEIHEQIARELQGFVGDYFCHRLKFICRIFFFGLSDTWKGIRLLIIGVGVGKLENY